MLYNIHASQIREGVIVLFLGELKTQIPWLWVLNVRFKIFCAWLNNVSWSILQIMMFTLWKGVMAEFFYAKIKVKGGIVVN